MNTTKILVANSLRTMLTVGAMTCFFFAITDIPLATAFGGYFLGLVFAAQVAAPVLGEQLTPARLGAAGLGLVGAALIVRPGVDLQFGSLLAVLSGIFFAGYLITTHGVESRYRLTRGILEVLARETYPGRVSILTTSPLVLRDVDVLQQIPQVTVGMTVTTTDDRLSRFLEVRAPLASRRLKTLQQLHAAGLPTYAFVGPLLPHFRYQPACSTHCLPAWLRLGCSRSTSSI